MIAADWGQSHQTQEYQNIIDPRRRLYAFGEQRLPSDDQD